jgi:hypothetical protein
MIELSDENISEYLFEKLLRSKLDIISENKRLKEDNNTLIEEYSKLKRDIGNLVTTGNGRSHKSE